GGDCGWFTDGSLSTPACEVISHTLAPGEGFIVRNFGGRITNSWTGCIPNCSLPCAPQIGVTNFIGPTGLATNASYTNVLSCPPPWGTLVRAFNGSSYLDSYYINGVWSPHVPVIAAGTAVFVTVVPTTNCATSSDGCLATDTNRVYQASGIANPN